MTGRHRMLLVAALIAVLPGARVLPEPPVLEGLEAGLYRAAGGDVFVVARWDFGERRQLTFLDRQTGIFRFLYRKGDVFYAGSELMTSAPRSLELELRGQSLLLRSVAAEVGHLIKPLPYRSEDVTFTNGSVQLRGTLLAPAHDPWRGAVVLLHGSGPLDRNSFGPFPFLLLDQGLGVLIYDKRGTGSSEGDFRKVSFCDELVEDARAAVEWLRRHPRRAGTPIGLFGISQGGMIAPALAERDGGIGFIVNVGGNVGPVWQQELHDRRETLRLGGVTGGELARAMELNRRAVNYLLSGEDWDAYRALRDSLAGEAWFPLTLSSLEPRPNLRWRKELRFELEEAWRKIRVPVLGLFGEQDVLTPVADSVARLRSAIDADLLAVHVLRGRNHLLLGPTVTGDLAELPQLQGYAPEALEQLEVWLEKVLARRLQQEEVEELR